MGGKQAHHATH